MLPKYTFGDATIYMKTEKGDYLNLTDYGLEDTKHERFAFRSGSEYVIMMCSFFYKSYRENGVPAYICDLSFEELLDLSGIHAPAFVNRFKDGSDSLNRDLLAVLCARKIASYASGKIVRAKDNKNCYHFFRHGYDKTADGKLKHKAVPVFVKEFYKA